MTVKPPIAEKRQHQFSYHGYTVDDPYHWLRDSKYPVVDDPDILTHLKAENAFFESHMAAHQSSKDALFQEMKGRIKEADKSVPQKDGDYLYWREFEEGAQYRKWYRKAADGSGSDQLILDEPALAKGHEYFNLGAISISPNARYLAYATDTDGSERFNVKIIDLESGEYLADEIKGILSALVWTSGSDALLYCLANEQWRTDNAHVHFIGKPTSEDVKIFNEDDDGFRVGVSMTSSERYIMIESSDHVTSEVWLLPADNPLAKPQLVSARKPGREYDVDEHDDVLYIHTNDTHPNFRLVSAKIETPDVWEERIAPSAEFYLTGQCCFKNFYVTEGRENGLDQVEIRSYKDDSAQRINFPEATYTAGMDDNPEFNTDVLRLGYASMVTPSTVFDYDLKTRRLETLKVQEIPSGYKADHYRTERLEIAARDGTPIPVSVVYHKDYKKDGSAPLHLYGYGAYGITIEPGFSTKRLSFLDRGFAYAIAHIRGGDDLGQQWYLDGKLKKRTNTFHDFVDVAKGLTQLGFGAAGKISISGGSAGGELMGAVINSDPDLWGAVVAHVPFVDVLNTMLDDSLPLTPGEWPEWGNPITDKAAYELIQSYSPYDQVAAQDYPPMLVTAGLNDPRVTYWEPAKWVAKLREHKTDKNLLLLKTNMGAGHGGKSGRFDSLEEDAEEMAFIFWQMGIES